MKCKLLLGLFSILAVGLLAGFSPQTVQVYPSVFLTAENCGIELVKTDKKVFSYEYMGIDQPAGFSVSISSKENSTFISASGPQILPNNFQISTQPEYCNTVRIYVPDCAYEMFALDCTQAPVSLSNLQASVVFAGTNSSFSLIDEEIQLGSYRIDNDAGTVHIEAGRIASQIFVSNRGNVRFVLHQPPTDIGLYLTDCSGQITLPVGWSTKNIFGNGTPGIWIQNMGDTVVVLDA